MMSSTKDKTSAGKSNKTSPAKAISTSGKPRDIKGVEPRVKKEQDEKDKMIEALQLEIEFVRRNLDPKVFQRTGIDEQDMMGVMRSSLKMAEQKIQELELQKGLTKQDRTEELEQAEKKKKKLENDLLEAGKSINDIQSEHNKVKTELEEIKKQHLQNSYKTLETKGNTSTQSEKSGREVDRLMTELNAATRSLEVAKSEKLEKQKEYERKDKELVELKTQIEELETRVKHGDELRALKTNSESSKKKQEEDKIKSLETDLQTTRKELQIAKKDLLSLQDEKKTIEGELKALKTKSESPNNSAKASTWSQEEINNMKKQIDVKDVELGKKNSEIQTMGKEIATLKKSHDAALTKLLTQEEKTKTLEDEHKRKLEKKDETINTLRREKTMDKTTPPGREDVGDIKQQLSMATQEIDELKRRLSKMVGENLTNNNPNITDLSDENRPTKLAETYSEMYDNEWTDAFEELEKQGSKELQIIPELLKIFQDTVKFCGKMAEQYIENLQKSASKLQEKTSTKNQYQKLHLLKELRKSYAPSLADEVFSLYEKEKNLKFAKTPKVEAYTKSCIKLSWLMSVQDPAVVIDEVKTPSKFDGDRYRTYTKSGTTIEFVVWPTMLLHAGGPILMKGVAQCK